MSLPSANIAHMNISTWDTDPTGRHQYRWFDGNRWTEHVANDGVQATDTITETEALLAAPTTAAAQSTQGASGFSVDPSPATLDPTTMLAPRARRFGGFVLDLILFIFTLGVGWLIWSLVIWQKSQTPAKYLLKMRVVKLESRSGASYGIMFLRQIGISALYNLIIYIIGLSTNNETIVAIGSLISLVAVLWIFFNDLKQTLIDKILGTVVINDPDGVFLAKQ